MPNIPVALQRKPTHVHSNFTVQLFVLVNCNLHAFISCVSWCHKKTLILLVILVAFTATIPASCRILVVMPGDLRMDSRYKWRSKQIGSCPPCAPCRAVCQCDPTNAYVQLCHTVFVEQDLAFVQ